MYLIQESQHLVIHPPFHKGRMSLYAEDRQTLLDYWASTKIQSVFRGIKSRKEVKKKSRHMRSTLYIQRFVRGMLGRKRFKKLRFKRTIAALHLQRVWRGHIGRVKYRDKHEEYSNAVMKLQSVFRGFVGRKQWKRPLSRSCPRLPT